MTKAIATAITEDQRRDLCAERVTINGKPAVISGVKCPFGSVRSLDGVISVPFSWHTVRHVVTAKAGKFQA